VEYTILEFNRAMKVGNKNLEVSRGGARWWRNRRPKFHLVPGIPLDSYQTIQNTYKLNRRSKKRITATL